MRRYIHILTLAEHRAALFALNYCAAVGTGGDFTARNVAAFEHATRAMSIVTAAEAGHYSDALRTLAADVVASACSCNDAERARGVHASDCVVRARRRELDAAFRLADLLDRKKGA